MNRSLLELKFCFLAALPLLCAGRAIERFGRLLIEPVTLQRAVFGRVVAYPWQLRSITSYLSENGVETGWAYRTRAFPTPAKACLDIAAESRPQAPTCGLDFNGGYLKAGWDKGEMWMVLWPPHRDPSLPEGDNQ